MFPNRPGNIAREAECSIFVALSTKAKCTRKFARGSDEGAIIHDPKVVFFSERNIGDEETIKYQEGRVCAHSRCVRSVYILANGICYCR